VFPQFTKPLICLFFLPSLQMPTKWTSTGRKVAVAGQQMTVWRNDKGDERIKRMVTAKNGSRTAKYVALPQKKAVAHPKKKPQKGGGFPFPKQPERPPSYPYAYGPDEEDD
jgi:hypothetical protein